LRPVLLIACSGFHINFSKWFFAITILESIITLGNTNSKSLGPHEQTALLSDTFDAIVDLKANKYPSDLSNYQSLHKKNDSNKIGPMKNNPKFMAVQIEEEGEENRTRWRRRPPQFAASVSAHHAELHTHLFC
jgi:hypothetical protein